MLYLLTPPDAARSLTPSALAAVLETGAVSWLQLRLKDTAEADIIAYARALQPLCARANVKLILNDSPALAATLQLDGAHVGSDDMPLKEARAALGTGKILGASCYDNLETASVAVAEGADYLAFGAFFDTTTKTAKTRPAPELLTAAKQRFPGKILVAIGGITVDNAGALLAHGADMLAVTAGVWQHPNGAVTAAHDFKTIMDKARL